MREITFQEVVDDFYVAIRYNKSNLVWIRREIVTEENLLRALHLFAIEAFAKGYVSPKKEIDTVRQAMVQLQHYGRLNQ